MEVFRIADFIMEHNPNPDSRFRREILTKEQKAEHLGGLFGLLAPGSQGTYHFHHKRESIIIAISGEATLVIDGKEVPNKANDILNIPAGEKHMTVNKTEKDFRYLEFFTHPPLIADFTEVN